MKKGMKHEGITLIALVVTIVVLLILAGISIDAIIGDNSIIKNAKKAVFVTDIKSIEDKMQIIYIGDELKNENSENSSSTKFGTIEGVTGEKSKYNDKLAIENGKLVYNSEKVSKEEKEWLEELGILAMNNNYYLVMRKETKENKFQGKENVGTIEDFRDLVNSGSFNYNIVYLIEDIDLQGSDNNTWIPIGNNVEHAFTGIFDGDNHKINNLYLNMKEDNQGLFGYNAGTIKNIGIESGGMVIKEAETTERINVGIGFLVGVNSGTIEKCYSNVDVNVSINTGIRVIGGIVGFANEGSKISKCYNTGNISINTITLYSLVCGIVGSCNPGAIIECCYNVGNIMNNAEGQNSRASGITNGAGNITSCYNIGSITLKQKNTETWPVSAGICAQCEGRGEIHNCYNIGETKIEIDREDTLRNGSIAGYADTIVKIENCYCWCSNGANAIGQDDRTDSSGGVTVYENKEDIKNRVKSLGTDYKADTKGKNHGYPILVWQDED